MKKKLHLILLTLVLTTISASAYFNLDFDFNGKVGVYPVTGGIELGTTGQVYGYYGYIKNGNRPKAWLNFSGSWQSINGSKYRIYMTETSNGHVSGSWNVVYDSRTRKLTGTMTTSKGKTYNVKATCR